MQLLEDNYTMNKEMNHKENCPQHPKHLEMPHVGMCECDGCTCAAQENMTPLFTYTHHTSPHDPVCQQTKDDRARILKEASAILEEELRVYGTDKHGLSWEQLKEIVEKP